MEKSIQVENLVRSKEHVFKNPGATQQRVGVLTIRWPCVCVQVCWWMWWVDEGRAQRRNSFKVQAGKARLGAACTRLSNLILLRRLLVFSCLGFLPENKQRDLWRDWLHIWEKAFLESVKDNFLSHHHPPLSSLFPYRERGREDFPPCFLFGNKLLLVLTLMQWPWDCYSK